MTDTIPTLAEQRKEAVEADRAAKRETSIAKSVAIHLRPVNIQLNVLEKTVARHAKRIDAIDVNVLGKFLDRTSELVSNLELRVRELDKMYQFMIHKETVLTEVSMYARKFNDYALLAQFHMAIMRAYNQPNEWWIEHREYTIVMWYERIMDLLSEPAAVYKSKSNDII